MGWLWLPSSNFSVLEQISVESNAGYVDLTLVFDGANPGDDDVPGPTFRLYLPQPEQD